MVDHDEGVGAVTPSDLLSLDELTERVGMSVRNVRFYTSRGLVPPPIRRGRSGYYTADHVARLELVQDLQSHGFTLAAIERYVAGIPATATPGDIALHRTMLAPWQSEPPAELTRDELDRRAGRTLSPDDLAVLTTLGVATSSGPGRYRVAVAHLSVALGLLEHGFPPEAAQAAAEVYAAHGRAVAEELNEIFKKHVWPAYKESGAPPEALRQVLERLKPLSVASLVTAYEVAMDAIKRESIARRTR